MNSSTPSSTRAQPTGFKRWLREPLLHFVMAGLALFLVYGALHGTPPNLTSHRIEVTADDIRRIEIAWLARWQRPPTAEQLRGLIDEDVKEEILYREALALGLEQGDTIIRRRLAQKMDFLAEDVAALREPAAGEVEAWFARNRERFASPPLVTFHHLFFASDKRGPDAQAQASEELATLTGKDSGGGDPFMFKHAYTEQTPDQVARVFGSKFAASLYQQRPGAWCGPLESGYGWHLVWIDGLTPSESPAFETVAQQARAEWLSEQRSEAKRVLFEKLKARYEIIMPASANGALSAKASDL